MTRNRTKKKKRERDRAASPPRPTSDQARLAAMGKMLGGIYGSTPNPAPHAPEPSVPPSDEGRADRATENVEATQSTVDSDDDQLILDISDDVAHEEWRERRCRHVLDYTASLYAAVYGYGIVTALQALLPWIPGTPIGYVVARLALFTVTISFLADDWLGSREMLSRVGLLCRGSRWVVRRFICDVLIAALGYAAIYFAQNQQFFRVLVSVVGILALGCVWTLFTQEEFEHAKEELDRRCRAAPQSSQRSLVGAMRTIDAYHQRVICRIQRVYASHGAVLLVLVMYAMGIRVNASRSSEGIEDRNAWNAFLRDCHEITDSYGCQVFG